MGAQESKVAGYSYSRRRLPGLDMITVSDLQTINAILNSGDVDRVARANTKPSSLPWLFRYYFPLTRFYNPKQDGWFLPLRSREVSSYVPCRAFLDDKFKTKRDVTEYAREAAELLCREKKATDRELSDVGIRWVWSHMVPEDHPPIPDSVLKDVTMQVGPISQAFLPWKVLPAHDATAAVFQFADDQLRSLGVRDELPDAAVTDTAHILFAMNLNGPPLLRALGDTPYDDLDDILIRLGLTKNSIRVCIRAGTLGGVLPSNEPASPDSSVVLIDIAQVAKETNDSSYAFASTQDRPCAAKHLIREFATAVQTEIKKRKSNSS